MIKFDGSYDHRRHQEMKKNKRRRKMRSKIINFWSTVGLYVRLVLCGKGYKAACMKAVIVLLEGSGLLKGRANNVSAM